MSWTRHAACLGEIRRAHKILVSKPEEKKPFEGTKPKRENECLIITQLSVRIIDFLIIVSSSHIQAARSNHVHRSSSVVSNYIRIRGPLGSCWLQYAPWYA